MQSTSLYIADQLDPKLLIDFERIDQQSVERLNMKGSRTEFRFTDLCRKLSEYGFFVECISTVFKYLIDVEGIRENYLLAISLESPSELEVQYTTVFFLLLYIFNSSIQFRSP